MIWKVLTLAFVLTSAVPAETPNAGDLLRAVRRAQSGQRANLKGTLLTKPADAMVRPVEASFRFVSEGPVVRYQFSDPEPVTLRIALGENDSELMQSGSSSGGKFTPAQFGRRVMGTDLTYEDLALKFIYWKNAIIEGEDRMKTRSVWRIRLAAPGGGGSNYGSVIVWVDKDSGALMKAEGRNPAGHLIKRFEVVSAQVIKGTWFLRAMRVETVDALSGKVSSRTTMEIEPPEE